MAHTKKSIAGNVNNGSVNTFSYSGSFDVFKASEVEVELDNVALTFTTSTINESANPREYTVDFTNKTVHIGGADLASTDQVVIQPVTDMGSPTPRATYTAGASVTSADLNNNQLQLLRKAMEYDEQKLSSRGGTMTGNLHMGEDVNLSFEGATNNNFETTITVADPTSDKTITFPDTTGTVVTTGDTGTVATGMIAADAITGAKIADDQINSEHYVDGSIDTAHIGSAQVNADKLASDSVITAKIQNSAVTTGKIADSNVTTAKIAADNITSALIADDQINSEHYVDGSIDTAHIADAQITTAKLVDSSVTTAKINADAIDGTKIADDSINSEHYVDGSIDHAHLSNDCIDGDNIQDDVINSEHYAADSIDTEHYAPNSVDTTALAADAVTGAQLADNAVDSEHYVDGSIDTAHIAGAQVTDAKLASNSVITSKITDANVTTVKIADSNVTLGKLASDLKQTTISDSDTQLPTSGAVVDYVAAQLLPFGGFEAVATEVAFPNTQPASGVIVSISDAAGVVVSGSGVSTTGRTVGGSTVTINNFPSSLNGETLASGVGLMVSSTGSSQIYNYHKILAAETDVKQLSDDINDFNARYRVGSSNPTSALDGGDLFFNTSTSKLLVYNNTNSAWEEAQSIGNFFISTFSEAFDGSRTQFTLSNAPANVQQIILSLNGVVQKPGTAFTLSGSTVTLASAPASGTDFFAVVMGSTVNIGTPSDGTVDTDVLTSGAVTTAKIADDAVTAAKLANTSVTAASYGSSTSIPSITVDAQGRITAASGNTVNTDLVGDTSPQLGGNLASNGNDILIADDDRIKFGSGNDLHIYHNQSNSVIREEGTGNLNIQTTGGNVEVLTNTTETSAKFISNGAVELYHDNSKKLETISNGIKVYDKIGVNITPTTALQFLDHSGSYDGKASWGNSADLQIYHDGSNSYIKDSGTGLLIIESNQLQIKNDAADEKMIVADANGAVELYYDNTKRFETTAAGIDVSGAGIFHSVGVSNALDIEQQTDGNYTGIRIRNFYSGSAKNMIAFLDDAGNVDGSIVINNSTTTYNTSSDYRLKENEVLISNGIERLKQLKPYKFNWKRNPSITLDGFFAHEAATVVPEAVTGTKDAVVTQAMIDAKEYTSDKLDQEIYQGIDQSKLVPLLTAALQEAIAKIETLETKVAALEAA